jgi:hypothetical protein
MRKVLFGVVSALLVFAVTVRGDEIPVKSNQAIEEGEFEGKASFVPWSGDWWNQKAGQLGIGWNGEKTFKWDDSSDSYEFNSEVETNDLSPLAKYDAWVEKTKGYNPESALYELESGHHVDPNEKEEYDDEDVDYSWWGHCNGWAAAAALEREPFYPIEADGIRFEVADLKGLLTESYYSQVSDFSGSRYYKPKKEHTEAYDRGKELLKAISKESIEASEYREWYEELFNKELSQDYYPAAYKGVLEYVIEWYDGKYTSAFEDIRPDVFHKILTNIIGDQKSVVVFDITAGEAVWNYPAYKFETSIEYLEKRRIKSTTSKYKYWRSVYNVTTTVTYADDGVNQSITGTRSFTKTYTYELYTTLWYKWLRGGKWTGSSVKNHPDFAWFPKYNPTGVDKGENPKLVFGKLLEILPKSHLAQKDSGLELFANGTGSSDCRTDESQVTFWNPVEVGSDVTFSYKTNVSGIKKVKYFEQSYKSFWDYVKVTRDPLEALGEGSTLTVSLGYGKHYILAYGYSSSGKLIAVDEITVKVQ